MRRRLPWWVVLGLGVVCVAIGVVLIAEPFRSLTVLTWLVALALAVTGLSELTTAEATPQPTLARLAGAMWIVAGVVAVAWPGITVLTLAIIAGVALVVGGAIKIAAAVSDDADERLIIGIAGAASVIVGVLALTWPAVTVLVLAVIFGIRTTLFGFSQIALAFRMRTRPGDTDGEKRPWPAWLRLSGALVALALALGGVAISVSLHRAQPGDPGPFYTAPEPLPDGPPGTIIRSEVIDGYYAGATTHRVLYLSTGYDGTPTAVSGLVVVPDAPAPPDGRKVVAYTHGTVGVAPSCAPSLRGAAENPLTVEGADALIAAGYLIAATDYQGLGTGGPHPYLIGEAEAMNAIDAVRAAGTLPDAQAGADFAVWGHSQGGHASLFTGQLAATYAPELNLVGVAAGGPVPDLRELFQVNIETDVGKILIAMALQSWAAVHDADLDDIVTPAARPLIATIARNCLYSRGQIQGSVPSSLLLTFTFISTPPWDVEPWSTIVADNSPGADPIGIPIVIFQGGADTIVDPETTERLVRAQCAAGESVDLRLLPGVGHLDTGVQAVPDVAQWLAARFADLPADDTC